MFEEEAEEWVKENMDCCKTDNSVNQSIPYFDEEERCCAKSAFQDGAEFGYNKANEWHKQESDDIYDVISQDWNIRYFICIMKDKSRVLAIGSCDEDCNGLVGVNLFFEYDDEKYYIDDIVWWKEIVLPELPKES